MFFGEPSQTVTGIERQVGTTRVGVRNQFRPMAATTEHSAEVWGHGFAPT